MEIKEFKSILKDRVLLLDGAMGTMVQKFNLGEKDYRGERFASFEGRLAGCNDVLCITQPDKIRSIHTAYLEAGADIISTNSFNANAISLEDYGLHKVPGLVREINRCAASVARSAAEAAPLRKHGGRALVAGSIGPTNRTASMSPDVADPSLRNVDYSKLFEAYSEQVAGLIEGGVDILLFETVFDTLNLKAGLDAASNVMAKAGVELPVMVSATVSDKAGRTLSGQTIKAFVTSVEGYDNVVSLGLNCSFGPADIVPYLRELSDYTSLFVSCHPNAGLPNALGEYDETPELFAAHLAKMLCEGLMNVAGGCCGTTPAHIKALSDVVADARMRIPPLKRAALRVSGLEMVEVLPENNFVNVGERCNVAGSRKFLRLIKEKKYDEAMAIAAKQVADGAMMIDVNMDDAMLDARGEMVHFLRYIASDPDIARVPVMVDSSEWNVVEAALENLQGKSIVNSISLKEGEEAFLKKARRIRELGAAVIVMAFDEKGQADTFARKIEVCERAYRLLIDKAGFNADDIIFDVNVMAVATGMEEHSLYGIDFIRAVEWVKKNLPGARTSGGISNLSFAFRGKNALREAMHAVFLYHAVKAGLDMGIVNPASSVTYNDIDPSLRELIEDVVLARRPEAADELAAYAADDMSAQKKEESAPLRDTAVPVAVRLTEAIVKGKTEFLAEDLDEALSAIGSAVKIIEGPLMEGMNRVGNLFGEGKMFLPQVVKTARTMKMAVEHLRPYMVHVENDGNAVKAGKVVFATVKGDVHDIGKNIVSIVLACNNYEVIDLGVMVPAEVIVDTVKKERPDLVCLSGLITPSLSEMVNVAKALEDAGLDVPLLVGGATTSKVHTALKIAPVYHAPVVHVADASQNPLVAAKLLNKSTRECFVDSLEREYTNLRNGFGKGVSLLSLAEARSRRKTAGNGYIPVKPNMETGLPSVIDIRLEDVVPFINWKMFFHAWKISGSFLDGFPYDRCDSCIAAWRTTLDNSDREKGEAALRLYCDAVAMLSSMVADGCFDGKGALAFYNGYSDGDDLFISGVRFPMLRQQAAGAESLCVADFVLPCGNDSTDYVGVFAVTAGSGMTERADALAAAGDSYGSILMQTLADRIAEASSEWLHYKARTEFWGYAPEEPFDLENIRNGAYLGIRPAMGYPMMPDQLLNHNLVTLLPFEKIGVTITENGAMTPSSTVSGIYISNPSSRYFMVGAIGDDQIADYAARRGLDETRTREILRL